MTDWTKDCELLDFLNVDICFCINEDFYYGPLDVESIADRRQTTPLPSVTNKSAATFNYRSLKAEDHAAKLLDYYREVLRLAKNYGRKDLEIAHYFWLKLYVWRPDLGISMEFPWYDCLDQITPVLDKIASDEHGLIFHDEDHNWDIDIVAQDGLIHIREGNFQDGEINMLHKTPRGPFAQECAAARGRAKSLVAWLSDELGRDYWTRGLYPEDFVAG